MHLLGTKAGHTWPMITWAKWLYDNLISAVFVPFDTIQSFKKEQLTIGFMTYLLTIYSYVYTLAIKRVQYNAKHQSYEI